MKRKDNLILWIFICFFGLSILGMIIGIAIFLNAQVPIDLFNQGKYVSAEKMEIAKNIQTISSTFIYIFIASSLFFLICIFGFSFWDKKHKPKS